MAKSTMFRGNRVMSGSDLYALLQDGNTKKAEDLYKKLSSEFKKGLDEHDVEFLKTISKSVRESNSQLSSNYEPVPTSELLKMHKVNDAANLPPLVGKVYRLQRVIDSPNQ